MSETSLAGESMFLSGQVALVTGAALRLGRAVSEALSAAGAGVVVHYRSSSAEAEALADQLQRNGREAWTIQADLGDADQASSLVQRASNLCGRPLDILINSASIFDPSRVLEFSLEELHANIQVNAFSPLLLCRGFAAQGTPGQIVNFLDARMVDYDREHAAYHLSKRMLHALTRMLALELAPSIRVNAVAPGLILAPPGKDEAYLEALSESVPLKRHGCAEDVVRAVLFLLQSDFVTGQVIYLDGGRNLRGNMYGG
jgi:NAD(P)-dependent dehydrogenase (short-subunit alcohol dehydrogenase family)